MPLSVPPRSTMMPALLTVAPVAEPPAEMMSAPLLPERPTFVLSTSVSIARPPEFTNSRPVLIRVVADATPPLFTVSWAWTLPLPLTVSLIVVPPSPLKVTLTLAPALMWPPDSTPPKLTFINPPLLTTVPIARPPELMASTPLLPDALTLVLLTMVPTATPPELTTSTPVLESTAPDAIPPPKTVSRACAAEPLPIS